LEDRVVDARLRSGSRPVCTASEMERMLKLQDVWLKATAIKITWRTAAETIGVTTGRCGGGGNG
jgi:hypothetical protein